jgi:hypothetical protein
MREKTDMQRVRFLTTLVVIMLLIGVVIPVHATAAPVDMGSGLSGSTQASPELQLAEKFAPVALLKTQRRACDRDGEGYFPAPMETILGNPEIALMKHGEDGAPASLVMMGATAQDLAGLDDSYYLDFPGNPRRPGCQFETDFKRYATAMSLQPTTYARVVVDEEHEQVVVQYWLWYYFNDWNNTHESDWEMIQIAFDTTSVTEALSMAPSRIGYAQHGGGELAEWDDSKLQRTGDRLIIHPAAGSHATYYGNEVYIGWGERGTGFGCDQTLAPSRTVPLNVVLIPDEIDADSAFAWLLFDGRWGEYQEWEFNGPVGPNKGGKWKTPVEAMEDWRDSSLAVPTSRNTVGPSSTDIFCTLSAGGSRVLIELGTQPILFVGLIVALLATLIFLLSTKRQEVREAIGFYVRHLRVFVLIGLTTIPIGITFNAFQYVVRENPPLEWVMKWFNDTAGARMAAVTLTGGFQQAAMVLVVSPPVIQAVADILENKQPTVRSSFIRGYRHFWPLAIGMAIVALVNLVLVLLVIGIPLAIFLGVRWQFYGQAAVLDGTQTGQASLGLSWRTVRGRWWQTLSDSLIFQLIAVIPGPLVGTILMLTDRSSVQFANTFSAVVYAITVPISIIGLTLAYKRYRNRGFIAPDTRDEQVPSVATAPAGD